MISGFRFRVCFTLVIELTETNEQRVLRGANASFSGVTLGALLYYRDDCARSLEM